MAETEGTVPVGMTTPEAETLVSTPPVGTPAQPDTAAQVQVLAHNQQLVRVKVTWNEREGRAVIGSNHDLPTCIQVLEQLDKNWLKLLDRYTKRSYYGLEQTITRSRGRIPLSAWSNAIAQATLMVLRASEPEAATEVQQMLHGGYLAVGDVLYQLNAVQAVGTNRALAAVRARVLDKVKVEAAEIREAAQRTAAGVLRTAGELRQQVEAELARARRELPPPAWAVEAELALRRKVYDSQPLWCVGMVLRIRVSNFVLYPDSPQRRWSWSVPGWEDKKPVVALVWVPLQVDGSYAVTTVYADETAPVLPHMTTAAACVAPGDAPERIRSVEELQQLRDGIMRAFRTVNLSSLYNSIYAWRERFKDYVPAEIEKAVFGSPPVVDALLAMAEEGRKLRAAAARQAAATAPRRPDVESPDSAEDVWEVNSGSR